MGERGRDVDLHPAKLDAESPGGCWFPVGIGTEECLGVSTAKPRAKLRAQLLLRNQLARERSSRCCARAG